MIIGLLMGIVISLAVALWLNRLSNPFVEKGRSSRKRPPKLALGAATAAAAAKRRAPRPKPPSPPRLPNDAKTAKAVRRSDRPRFEFYQILPGDKEAPDKDAQVAAEGAVPQPAAAAAAGKPGHRQRTPKAHSRRDVLAPGGCLRRGEGS